jgi:hypothetical protein
VSLLRAPSLLSIVLFAWILWSHHSTIPASEHERWSRISAQEVKRECEKDADLALTGILRSNRSNPSVKRVGNTLVIADASAPPITVISLECWPDTVDPREGR